MIPSISICIPAFQAQGHLRATLRSALSQDHPRFEVVVVDNNSTDFTGRILEEFSDDRLRVVRNPETLPMADNFNAAIDHSRGRHVKLVCADDILAPECIRKQSDVLDTMPDVTVVSTRTDFIDEFGCPLRRHRGLSGITGHNVARDVIRTVIRSGTNPIGPPVATMFRRADFVACGGFSSGPSFVGDLELWARLLERGSFFGLPETLAAFRIQGESLTAKTSSRTQRADLTELISTLTEDPRWGITASDVAIGRLRVHDMEFRRKGLYLVSSLRSRLRRHGLGALSARESAMTSGGPK